MKRAFSSFNMVMSCYNPENRWSAVHNYSAWTKNKKRQRDDDVIQTTVPIGALDATEALLTAAIQRLIVSLFFSFGGSSRNAVNIRFWHPWTITLSHAGQFILRLKSFPTPSNGSFSSSPYISHIVFCIETRSVRFVTHQQSSPRYRKKK